MKFIILSKSNWEEYEYKRMLELLPNREEVCFVGRMTSEQQISSHVKAITATELYSLNVTDYTLFVSSPYWLPEVLKLKAGFVVALLERGPEGENRALWDKFSGLLGAKADLVGSVSERIYLEQSLRRDGVFYLSGDQRESYGIAFHGEQLYFLYDYEVLWNQALQSLWQDSSALTSDYSTIQWQLRAEYYISMCERLPHEPSVHYLAASYLYLLEDDVASRYLGQSFELMILHDYIDCLYSHFRFFSAIETKKGNLDIAVQQYTITAVSTEEKKEAARIQGWLESGQHELVRAELFRVNEDEVAAIRILGGLSSPEARALLVQNYIRTFQWERALEIQRELTGKVDEIMEGTLHLLHGRRHEAIRSFLNAAGQDNQAWPLLSEMADLEAAIERLRRKVEDE